MISTIVFITMTLILGVLIHKLLKLAWKLMLFTISTGIALWIVGHYWAGII